MSEALYLVNYCHKNCEPLQNIMRLPKDQAFSLAARFAEANPNTTAFGRFADFQCYYPERLEIDRKLYRRFMELGGRPLEEHPLSFVLQGSEMLDRWFGYGVVTRVPLETVPASQLSFTYGDSMTISKRLGGFTMLTKPELYRRMAEFPGSPQDFVAQINREYSYMEAQFWGRAQDLTCV